MREWMKSLVKQVAAWPGVSSHEHRFGGIEFRLGVREIGHVHSFGIVDIPFTVKVRDALIRAGRAERHHWLPNSGWTTVHAGEHETANAVALLRLSYLRIRMKNEGSEAAAETAIELLSGTLEHEVLEAAGISAPALGA